MKKEEKNIKTALCIKFKIKPFIINAMASTLK